MSRSTDLLNKVKNMLVSHANENGIDLSADFASVEEFQTFVVAFTFKTLKDAGASTEDAYNAVMGDGKYNELASNVWDELAA